MLGTYEKYIATAYFNNQCIHMQCSCEYYMSITCVDTLKIKMLADLSPRCKPRCDLALKDKYEVVLFREKTYSQLFLYRRIYGYQTFWISTCLHRQLMAAYYNSSSPSCTLSSSPSPSQSKPTFLKQLYKYSLPHITQNLNRYQFFIRS